MINSALKQVMTDKEIEIYLELVIKDLYDDFRKEVAEYDENLTKNHKYLGERHQLEMMSRNFEYRRREFEEAVDAIKLTLLTKREVPKE